MLYYTYLIRLKKLSNSCKTRYVRKEMPLCLSHNTPDLIDLYYLLLNPDNFSFNHNINSIVT